MRIAGRWMYLFRAVDSHGETVDFYLSETRDREAAKIFLEKALANPENRTPQVFSRDGLLSYAAIRELQAGGYVRPRCRQLTRRYCNNRVESDRRHVKRRVRVMQGPRTTATAWAVIQGIEAAQMIRKGQVLRITRQNLHGQAWVFGALLAVAQMEVSTSANRTAPVSAQMQHIPSTLNPSGVSCPHCRGNLGTERGPALPHCLHRTKRWAQHFCRKAVPR